jgi:N-acetylglucosamine-6-phosphate deacetylase
VSVTPALVPVVGAVGPDGAPITPVIDAQGRLGDRAPGRAAEAPLIDGAGLSVEPGFVDLQVNGGFGHDLTVSPDRVWDVGTGLAAHGVAAFLPTLVSPSTAQARSAADVLCAGPPPGWIGAVPLGLHLEGPALSPSFAGAHPPSRLVEPTPAVVDGWLGLDGVKLVTLAPELPGALEAIRRLRSAGVAVAVGHTGAGAARIEAAADAGATMVTHLFNAMTPFHHRDPGPVAAVLDDDRLTVGLIADGVHVAPAALGLAWRAAGPDRIALTGDTVAALGTGPEVGRTAAGALAGGATSYDRVRWTFLGAIGAAGPVPAVTAANACRVLGESDRGTLAPGARADLVLLDGGGRPVVTVVGGRVVHDPGGRFRSG